MTLRDVSITVCDGTVDGITKPHQWNEPTFENFGTVSFSQEFIFANIGYGDPIIEWGPQGKHWYGRRQGNALLSLWPWIEFVPECYRDKITEGVKILAPQFLGYKATPSVMRDFSRALSIWIGQFVDPIREIL